MGIMEKNMETTIMGILGLAFRVPAGCFGKNKACTKNRKS